MSGVPRLLLLTDAGQLPAGRTLQHTLAACAAAGLRDVVVRELHRSEDERAAIVADAITLGLRVRAARTPLPGVVGVHLAAYQAVEAAGGLPHGRSCHDRAEVALAAEQGATYVTLSPFALTASKPGHGPALPPDAYAGHPLPVLALGGLTPQNLAFALGAGADGVAVMGAVMRSTDPAEVITRLLEGLPA